MGSRFIQVVLSQLRLRFSNLKEHLFSKGCIDSPQCRCSGGSETKHYFIKRLDKADLKKIYLEYYIIIPMIRVPQKF